MKTVLSHANLIDCIEPKVWPDSAVLIEDGRIRAILPSGEVGGAADTRRSYREDRTTCYGGRRWELSYPLDSMICSPVRAAAFWSSSCLISFFSTARI